MSRTSNHIRYSWLRLCRAVGPSGAIATLALALALGWVCRDYPLSCQRLVLMVLMFAGAVVPTCLSAEEEADLALPHSRREVFAARTVTGGIFLAVCLLAAVPLSVVCLGGQSASNLPVLLVEHAVLGLAFQTAACYLTWLPCRRLFKRASEFAVAGAPCVILMVTFRNGGEHLAPVSPRVLGLTSALAGALLFVARRRYLAGQLPLGRRAVAVDPVTSPSRGRSRGWLRGSVGDRSACYWIVLIIAKERVLRLPFVLGAAVVLPSVWLMWDVGSVFSMALVAMAICVVRHLQVQALALGFLPVSKRKLFRLVTLPVLVAFFVPAIAVQWCWQGFYTRPTCLSDTLPYVEAICHRANHVTFWQSGLWLRDDMGYRRRATGVRLWPGWHFSPYEFDGADPPSFVAYQAQRFLHDAYSLEVPRSELAEAYQREPTQWLSGVLKKYSHARITMRRLRRMVGLAILASMVVLMLLASTAGAAGYRFGRRLPWVVWCLFVATYVPQTLGESATPMMVYAALCDAVFQRPWLATALWLGVCVLMYGQAERCFTQIQAMPFHEEC